ncbi:MAG: hypothetical protein ACKVIO_08925, partial [Phycisphaerales bacterium]
MSFNSNKLFLLRALLVATVSTPTALFADSRQGDASLTGLVQLNQTPVSNAHVKLYKSGTINKAGAILIASTKTNASGDFILSYTTPSLANGILYIVAEPVNSHNQVATILGSSDLPSYVVVNELTTVATAYTMNPFLNQTIIGGNSVGVRNSASTFRNLVDQTTGTAASVISTTPNGSDTEALGTFNTLGNILAAAASSPVLYKEIRFLSTPPCDPAPATLLDIAVSLARFPTSAPEALLLASQENIHYSPALTSAWHGKLPITWTLMLLYGNDDQYLLDGPGRIVIDKEGSIWIANNFAYEESSTTPACAGPLLLRLQPNGEI